MKYGDKDGYKVIYDDSGELILHPNERILVSEENVVPSFKSTWRYYGGDYLLEPSKGTLYLTNERILFINIPERMFAIGGGDEMRAMNSTMKSSFDLGDVTPGATVHEYFEIPNIELMASEKKEGAVSFGTMINLYILSSGNQYHLSMVLSENSEILKRLMNKRVDSLDELVNNLKDFFQRTDWMFTEAEKKIFQRKTPQQAAPQPVKQETKNSEKAAAPETSPDYRSGPDETKKSPVTSPGIKRDISDNSIRYFQNLYKKGLITEEIYTKLMGQFGMEPEEAEEIDERLESDRETSVQMDSEQEGAPHSEDDLEDASQPDILPDIKELSENSLYSEEEENRLLEIIDSTLAGVENADRDREAVTYRSPDEMENSEMAVNDKQQAPYIQAPEEDQEPKTEETETDSGETPQEGLTADRPIVAKKAKQLRIRKP
jgi:hypothetical protein